MPAPEIALLLYYGHDRGSSIRMSDPSQVNLKMLHRLAKIVSELVATIDAPDDQSACDAHESRSIFSRTASRSQSAAEMSRARASSLISSYWSARSRNGDTVAYTTST